MNISFLRSMYAHPGPWVSVYIDDSHNTERARQDIRQRWRDARDSLARAGAPEGLIESAERALMDAPLRPGSHGAAVFAGSDDTAYNEWIPAPPGAPEIRFDALPHVVPMLQERGQQVTWLRVVADRTGATIEYATTGSLPRRTEVTGSETFPIRKISPGDWAQARYQREAELTWQRNAGEVAAAVAELADRIGPDVLILAGDVQARRLLHEQLPVIWRNRSVLADGSRAENADMERLDDVTVQLVAESAAGQDDRVLDRLREQSGERSALGLAATLAAINRAQVETLVLDPSTLGLARLGIDPSDQLQRSGFEDRPTLDAGDALVWAATSTAADVVVVGPDQVSLPDGVGAVLRYRDESTLQGRR
jgi:release factor family 2